MKLLNKVYLERMNSVSLRKAGNIDGKEIGRENTMFFNNVEEDEGFPQ